MCQQIGKRWKRISAWMVVVSALAGMQGLGPLSLPGAGQAAASTALSIAPARYANAIEQGQKVALELVGRGIPGVSVAVAVNGEIVWSDGFGYADLEERVPVWPSTRFRIGSISKSLTADALAQLYEQGRLDLDAPVQRYVPSFPDKGDVITTRQLAGHLSGIRAYKGDEFLLQKHYATVLDGLAVFKDDPLLFPPGTKFSYSSYGFNLLSAVLESASGEAFLSYMREHIFLPLGMHDTVADENEKIVEHRTRFYTRAKEGELQNGPYVDNSYKWAGGGFLSTGEDLVRFGSAHLRGGHLKPATLALLFTSQRTKAGEETGYGIGWFIGRKGVKYRVIGHGGGSIGGTSQLALFPDSNVVVAVLTNLTEAPLKFEDVQRIAEPFMK